MPRTTPDHWEPAPPGHRPPAVHPPLVASELAVNSLADAEEKNGFTLVDMTPRQIEVSLFRWRRGEPEERIDGLQAYHTYKVSRG